MKIGFDAKRLFFNSSGLGNYSRSTVEMIAKFRPEDQLVLFSPKPGNRQGFMMPENAVAYYPQSPILRGPLRSVWRTSLMGKEIRKAGIDLYHGLSHELPTDMGRSGAKSIVTMHDLIFVRHPELYKSTDRILYVKKYRRSCELADRIIAISEQTKKDLVHYWNQDPNRIDVVYQGCDPIFYSPVSQMDKDTVRQKYALPEGRFILSVGTIEPRKNLMLTVKAMAEGKWEIPLVACGRWTPYQDEIMEYAKSVNIGHLVHFRNQVRFEDLPAIYQMAEVLVYASVFEGFGIPILEALNSKTPVVTSFGGVFPETGGDAALYVDPQSVYEMKGALEKVLSDQELRNEMIGKGSAYALNFREDNIFPALWASYQKALK